MEVSFRDDLPLQRGKYLSSFFNTSHRAKITRPKQSKAQVNRRTPVGYPLGMLEWKK